MVCKPKIERVKGKVFVAPLLVPGVWYSGCVFYGYPRAHVLKPLPVLDACHLILAAPKGCSARSIQYAFLMGGFRGN